MVLKLHPCPNELVRIRADPWHRVQKALDAAGIDLKWSSTPLPGPTCPANDRHVFTRMAVIFIGRKWDGPRKFTQRLQCEPLSTDFSHMRAASPRPSASYS